MANLALFLEGLLLAAIADQVDYDAFLPLPWNTWIAMWDFATRSAGWWSVGYTWEAHDWESAR